MIRINRIIPAIYYSTVLFLFFVQTKNIKLLFKLNCLKRGNARLKIKIRENYFLIRDLYDVFGLREVFVDTVYASLFDKLYNNTTFIDLGGYIGDSAIFASGFKEIKQIIVVEPFPENQFLIEENIRLNKIKNIKVIKAAIAKEKGKRVFFTHRNRGQSGFKKLNNNVLQIKVPTITLSEIVKSISNKHIVLKCDIEGAEYEIFMNASAETFKKIDRIIFEYHMPQDKLNRLLNYLRKIGFNVSFNKQAVESNLGNVSCFKE